MIYNREQWRQRFVMANVGRFGKRPHFGRFGDYRIRPHFRLVGAYRIRPHFERMQFLPLTG